MIIEERFIDVSFIRKSNIKHVYLKIIDINSLEIRANKYFTIQDAKKLIVKKEAWILKAFERLNDKVANENEYYFLGKRYQKESGFELDDFYKNEAIKLLPALVQKHSKLMQLFPSALKFRKNKTRFGSCSGKNSISLNILLMKYPQEVIEYVIIHELAHIKHKNHSKHFWNFVEIYCPNYKELDKMLKLF